ncbi:feruloyl-CoA synthase [Oceanibacterium hippocampi]|uniref:Long-chain-fatty-acid--CoA ligase n=1 Tax=Oceanibacterium hippocampi TaxID=745714 RepID=A0A1Y5TTG2_9PROT|nr:feruloyl-CoA synthase [Oceanibacterium hippocampi]SLN69835.1 Long-chain-fatty-acid--CoA ligase [Oceanibacterium hippocampi]
MSSPFASLAFAKPVVDVEPLGGGGMILRSPEPLLPYERHLGEMLRAAAAEAPERDFLCERAGDDGWRRLTYGQARRDIDAVAASLLARGLGHGGAEDARVMILSGNSIDSALLTLGAMQAGVTVVPVSPAYSLMSEDHVKLRTIFRQIRPALVYVEHAPPFAKALAALPMDGIELFYGKTPPADGSDAAPFSELLATTPGPEVEAAFAAIGPDHVGKILFTSGSTGQPKGVLNTQRMMCANQQQILQASPHLAEVPPVIVDWLPWNHTFGGNHNFNLVLKHKGTLYIDEGKPAPGLIEKSVAAYREIAPTHYFNVPGGFALFLPYLESDPAFRDHFFSRLRLIFYAASALPQDLWKRVEALSVAARKERVVMVSSWGATETAPAVTAVHWEIDRAGIIGLPLPGAELKFVPSGEKLEMRVRGPNVTPGYLDRADLTAEAFDADGFYRIGDAGRLADPSAPEKGVVFDGRVSEDFKLTSGTWVHVGALRIAALEAAAPYLQDVVVAGQDRDEIGLIAWPNLAACKTLTGEGEAAAIVASPALRETITAAFAGYNRRNPGASVRIPRLVLQTVPPSIDANEITDKGYINQRAVLEQRAGEVARLFAETPDDAVIVIAD